MGDKPKFKVGDKVKLIVDNNEDTTSNPMWGGKYGYTKGVVVESYKESNLPYPVRVDWIGQSWAFYKESDLELISSGETNKPEGKTMNILTSKIKRLFNKDLQTQYKAGLIDNCGDLTDKGKEELNEIVRSNFAPELTAIAEEIIKEEKENK